MRTTKLPPLMIVLIFVIFNLTSCVPKSSIIYPKNAPSIISDFGSWYNTKGGIRKKKHNGIDISGKIGDQILAVADGIILKSDYHPTLGFSITIDHGRDNNENHIMTVYYHNDVNWVEKGDRVSLGDKIGELGHCPRCLTPHLHFSVWKKMDGSISIGPFQKFGKPGKDWYPVSPHSFWYNGPNNITCYDPLLKKSKINFKFIYPVKCK